MVIRKSLEKYAFLTCIILALSLLAIQSVSAQEANVTPPPPPQTTHQADYQKSKAMKQSMDAFLQDTTALRKNMMVNRYTMRALLKGSNPDPEQVAALASQLFDLREQLRIKANEHGLPAHHIMGWEKRWQGCDMAGSDAPMRKHPRRNRTQ